MRDTIYADSLNAVACFAFDEKVAAVFPDMIERSVPGYRTIIAMTGMLAARHAQDGSRCYDLGCSLGASTLAMAAQMPDRAVEFIAVDNSPAMLARCKTALAHLPAASVQLLCDDLQNVPIQNACVVVLNFTLQFVPLAQRDAVIQRIYHGLRPGGVLVVSEKIAFDNPLMQKLNTDLHHDFKKANGYSELEVAQKRAALEQVLLPETLPTHEKRLQQAGFSNFEVWFQCFNFVSLVAIK